MRRGHSMRPFDFIPMLWAVNVYDEKGAPIATFYGVDEQTATKAADAYVVSKGKENETSS